MGEDVALPRAPLLQFTIQLHVIYIMSQKVALPSRSPSLTYTIIILIVTTTLYPVSRSPTIPITYD